MFIHKKWYGAIDEEMQGQFFGFKEKDFTIIRSDKSEFVINVAIPADKEIGTHNK